MFFVSFRKLLYLKFSINFVLCFISKALLYGCVIENNAMHGARITRSHGMSNANGTRVVDAKIVENAPIRNSATIASATVLLSRPLMSPEL